jgi:uncharacterized protein (TIGR02246 family)
MIKTCVKAAVSILLLVSLSLVISPAKEPANTDADSAAVRQAIADWIDAFNHHDAHATTMSYSEDADLTNMREVNYHGRKEIEQLFQTIFATRLKNAHRTAVVKRIRFLTPTLAAVDGDWEMTGVTADDGSVVPPRKGYLVLTMTQQDGRWLITLFHEPEYGLAAPTP